jgi:biopolymer transport protein ExbD
MKVRNVKAEGDKIEIQMTPMIDIVFQLLVFFIMTFKIVAAEGDFNIKMPIGAPREGLPDPNQLPPMKLKLRADSNGQLVSMRLNEKGFSRGDWGALRGYIIGILGDDRGPNSIQASAEVELDCDYDLRYEHVIDAITAVSGYKSDDDNVVKLIEKIKFSPPKRPTGG